MKRWKIGICWAMLLVLLCGSASAVSMKKGSKSYNVLFLQERLNQLGYNAGKADGLYDSETITAVKEFQRDRGLKVTGEVKDDTWAVLFDQKYTLRYERGIGKRDYTVTGRLAAPFSRMEVYDSSDKTNKLASNQARMLVQDLSCNISMINPDQTLEELIQAYREKEKEEFNQSFAGAYDGKAFKAGQVKATKINGKSARIWTTTWVFTNGDRLTRYNYRGIMAVDKVDGRQVYVSVSMAYNIPRTNKDFPHVLGIDAIQEILAGIRCDQDRLNDYQAGAARRKKLSKLKIKLPAFQPVEEKEQGTLDMIYEIWHYVDPAADGSSGPIDGSTCVSMYYGVKIMERYMYLVDAGNQRSDARTEAVMSLANSAFYDDFRAARPEIREKLAAAMSAAKLALSKDSKAYLTLLGLETPRWTAEELEEMTQSLVGAMDRMINQGKEQI